MKTAWRKDALYAGDWHLPDGRVFRCRPEDLHYFGGRMKEMVSAGLHIPLSWEHQDVARPMTAEEWQRRNAEMTRLTIDHVRHAGIGNVGGKQSLLVGGEAAADDDVDLMRKAKFASPDIVWNYEDPTGKLWAGPSIVALAVTARPIQHTQQPFQFGSQPGQPIMLSAASYAGVPMAPVRLSLDLYRGDATVPDPMTTQTAPAPAGGDDAKIKSVLAKLKGLGFDLPDDTNAANFVDRLNATLDSLGGGAGDMSGSEAVQQAPVLMSQNRILRNQLVSMQRGGLGARIKRLANTGRIPPTLERTLLAELDKAPLSLSANGSLSSSSPLVSRIEAYEALPRGPMASKGDDDFEPVSLSNSLVPPDRDDGVARAKQTKDGVAAFKSLTGMK